MTPSTLEITGYTDRALQARARKLADAHDGSRRTLARRLDVAPSSLHEALEGSADGRLRTLRMRIVEELSAESCHTVTVIAVQDAPVSDASA